MESEPKLNFVAINDRLPGYVSLVVLDLVRFGDVSKSYYSKRI